MQGRCKDPYGAVGCTKSMPRFCPAPLAAQTGDGGGLRVQQDPLGSPCASLQPVGQTSGGEFEPRKQHGPAQGNVMDVAVPVCFPGPKVLQQ